MRLVSWIGLGVSRTMEADWKRLEIYRTLLYVYTQLNFVVSLPSCFWTFTLRCFSLSFLLQKPALPQVILERGSNNMSFDRNDNMS